jgi:hypothetical protein
VNGKPPVSAPPHRQSAPFAACRADRARICLLGKPSRSIVASIIRPTGECRLIEFADPAHRLRGNRRARRLSDLIKFATGMRPTCVRTSPGKEDGCDLKPFIVTQRVRHPPGKGGARQPEASLAWATATAFVKRRQRILKPCGSLEIMETPKPSPCWARGQHRESRHGQDDRFGRGLRAGQRYGRGHQGT